ncbi:MAG: GntR family transcriptional regulator [Firmicutes bacterium]|nr:GntR family transcriptional regulator [Bacillota bacterium]
MLNFDIQNHKPLREMVYEELKIQILTGTIVPGTRMMEVDLAEEMGVSRTPIREAIRKLEKEGLVTIEPRRGAYASMISTQDMVEILEVRQDLEGLAAYLAASRMSPVEMEELKEVADCYNEAVKSGNMQDLIRYDTQFHRLIVDSCNNKILVNMVEQLQELVLRFRYIYYDNFKRAENMPEEHREIIEAIASGDEKRARAAADIHIDRLKQLVIEEGVQQKLVSEE